MSVRDRSKGLPSTRTLALLVALSHPDAFAQSEGPSTIGSTQGSYEGGVLVLRRDSAGDGTIVRIDAAGNEHAIECERLVGAWGLWLDDVDHDGHIDVLIALRKRARFDPVMENRLHVYALDADRCVPMWRGTRLAGRFDSLAVERGSPGALIAWERIGDGSRRVARYRWINFGYVLERVLWAGRGAMPSHLRPLFRGGEVGR